MTVFAHEECIPRVREKLTSTLASKPVEKDIIARQVSISEQGTWVGSRLKTLNLPPNCILAGIERDGEQLEIQADTVLEAGDRLELIGKAEELDEAGEYLSAGKE